MSGDNNMNNTGATVFIVVSNSSHDANAIRKVVSIEQRLWDEASHGIDFTSQSLPLLGGYEEAANERRQIMSMRDTLVRGVLSELESLLRNKLAENDTRDGFTPIAKVGN